MRKLSIISCRPIRGLLPLLAGMVLAACAPPPIYKPDAAVINATPAQVAAMPERYRGAEVIWGGRIVAVRNFPDHSEIELLGFPLDSSQRPQIDQPAGGRFIALLPGYIEAMDYPAGALLTLRGHIESTRNGKVGDADYVFPVVRGDQFHHWTPEELRSRKPNISFGVGIGVIGGIH